MAFKGFLLLDRLGLHILPKHYYSPVPDHRWLKRNERLWLPSLCSPVIDDMNLDEQIQWLDTICRDHYSEIAGLADYEKLSVDGVGQGYGPIESQVLHCFVRRTKPRNILEVGGGVTTACMASASNRNRAEGRRSIITCVEPSPAKALTRIPGIDIIREPCQSVSPTIFQQLGAGDLLFIDSSHSVKTGSDVLRLYLETIPKLNSGVVVHIHDIYLPYVYPRDALRSMWNWQETALLLALLNNNSKISVLSSLSMLHYKRPADLKAILSDYDPAPNREGLSVDRSSAGHFPSSIWLEIN